MKKLLVLVSVAMLVNVGYSQWSTHTVDNGLDDVYKIAYSRDLSKKALLKMEVVNEQVVLYVTGSYFCSETPLVQIAFKVGAENVRYSFVGNKSADSRTVFFMSDMLEEGREDFVSNFKRADKLIMRVNEEHCGDELYSFDMKNSEAALRFMSSKVK